MARGPSKACAKAGEYHAKHPEMPLPELAKKFGIDLSTIYRSNWWKAAKSKTDNK